MRRAGHFRLSHLSGISLAISQPGQPRQLFTLLRERRANGGKVIFDNNYRPRLPGQRCETQQCNRGLSEMLACTDIASTLDDEDALWGEKPVAEVIARTHAAGVEEVVVKRGADACLVSVGGQPLREVPAVKGQQEGGGPPPPRPFAPATAAASPDRRRCRIAARRGHLTASTIQYRGAIIPREAMLQ